MRRAPSTVYLGAMLKGFKDFIMKGNVLDLAVAVIIGAAFGAVVTALVDSVLMPFISALFGSPNFDSFAVVTLNGNDIKFGVLLTAIVNFLLIAAAVYFVIIMPMNKVIEARNRKLGIDPDAVAPSDDIVLLTEIRDLLAARSEGGPATPPVDRRV
jgi:large conductance mechanosensitive channel